MARGWRGTGEERELEQIFTVSWGETGNPCWKAAKPALASTAQALAAAKVGLVEETQSVPLLTLAATHSQGTRASRTPLHSGHEQNAWEHPNSGRAWTAMFTSQALFQIIIVEEQPARKAAA